MRRLHGTVDEMILGVDLSRGRESGERLKVNDVVDFWREDDKKEQPPAAQGRHVTPGQVLA